MLRKSKVMAFLSEMSIKGLFTYGALIAGCCEEKRLDKASVHILILIERRFATNFIICSKIVSSLY